MKKWKIISLVILVIALLVSNVSESEFQNKVDNSREPLTEFYMARTFKHASPIIKSSKGYFSPVFDLSFTNLGLFSIANLNSGWMGTLRIDGKRLDRLVDKQTHNIYLIIFGKYIRLSSSQNFE
ncbi:hypothetical protein ACFS5M_14115 [Lacinutrix iliipiscaria]|uniref:Uncharacterized protein n=1 Tax=Lacinutrix iliipiscaria TaxID=1230532 RepID=A0ABW5WQQ3_9FLAO